MCYKCNLACECQPAPPSLTLMKKHGENTTLFHQKVLAVTVTSTVCSRNPLSNPKGNVCRALCTSNVVSASTTFPKTLPTTPVPQHFERRRRLPSEMAMVSTNPSPGKLVPPVSCCLCSQNKGFNVTAQWVWGKYPVSSFCSGGSSSQRNNKRAFGQECKYFLPCWMQVGMGNVTGHGCEKK